MRRLLLGYAVVFAFGGIPLIYMGDEIAMLNDLSYLEDPALADDSRWMHRPFMDWAAVASPRTVSAATICWPSACRRVCRSASRACSGSVFTRCSI